MLLYSLINFIGAHIFVNYACTCSGSVCTKVNIHIICSISDQLVHQCIASLGVHITQQISL